MSVLNMDAIERLVVEAVIAIFMTLTPQVVHIAITVAHEEIHIHQVVVRLELHQVVHPAHYQVETHKRVEVTQQAELQCQTVMIMMITMSLWMTGMDLCQMDLMQRIIGRIGKAEVLL